MKTIAVWMADVEMTSSPARISWENVSRKIRLVDIFQISGYGDGHVLKVCNGVDDCFDGSDELECIDKVQYDTADEDSGDGSNDDEDYSPWNWQIVKTKEL